MKQFIGNPPIKVLCFLILLFPSLLSAQEISQQVIGSAGDEFKTSELSISFTLGELASKTLMSGNTILTQGFHQGNLSIISTKNEIPPYINLKAYPNPTKDILYIESQKTGLEYKIINSNGNIISNGFFYDQINEMDLSDLPPGIYFLAIKNKRIYKIIKQ